MSRGETSAHDSIDPARPVGRRISVVGNSGAGKTTVGRRLAAALEVPFVELDALFHRPGWSVSADFERDVAHVLAQPAWVVDGNYGVVRADVWARADTVVWVDPPRLVVLGRVVRRTLGRAITRRELWHGNRESWRGMLSLDPERSIIMWSLTRHRTYRERYASAALDPHGPRVVRLRRPRDVRRLLAEAAH